RRPARIACWPTGAISTGGTRWSPATPRRCTRPAFRCAGGWARARTRSRTPSSKTASSAGRPGCRRRRGANRRRAGGGGAGRVAGQGCGSRRSLIVRVAITPPAPSPPAAGARPNMRDPLSPPPDYLEHAAARRIVVGVLLTMLLAALDQVMVATALPSIAASLGDVENLSWVVTANLLCATAATPLYGKLSDIYGRRAMMLIAIGVYATGSLACALAPSMLALILGRALQGLGGGGLMPLVQTIIGDVASPRDRPRYQAYTSSTFIVSTVGGPILGGFI